MQSGNLVEKLRDADDANSPIDDFVSHRRNLGSRLGSCGRIRRRSCEPFDFAADFSTFCALKQLEAAFCQNV